jgi:hypothetical protein
MNISAMKTSKIYILLTGLFLFGLGGCAVTDMDRSVNFTKYQTYSWGDSEVEVKNPLYDSDLINKKIRTTVENEFAKRGIVANPQNPDFLVRYHTYTEEKERVSGGYNYGYPYFPLRFYPYAFGWGYPYHWMSPQMKSDYTEGTLIIDIVDRQTDELVWRGSVSGNVDDVSGLKKQIEKGIKAIMKKYPVRPDDALRIGNGAETIS